METRSAVWTNEAESITSSWEPSSCSFTSQVFVEIHYQKSMISLSFDAFIISTVTRGMAKRNLSLLFTPDNDKAFGFGWKNLCPHNKEVCKKSYLNRKQWKHIGEKTHSVAADCSSHSFRSLIPLHFPKISLSTPPWLLSTNLCSHFQHW